LQQSFLNAPPPVEKDLVVLVHDQPRQRPVAPQTAAVFQKVAHRFGRPGAQFRINRPSETGPELHLVEKEVQVDVQNPHRHGNASGCIEPAIYLILRKMSTGFQPCCRAFGISGAGFCVSLHQKRS